MTASRLHQVLALLAPLLLAPILGAQTQQSHIGGAQTTNTHVEDPAPTTTSTSDASGTAHVVVHAHAATRIGAKAGGTKPVRNPATPMNDTIPTDPETAVELSDIGFRPLILHRSPCVVDDPHDAIHTRGPVVVDIHLDQNGALERLDYIGPPDIGQACMEAVHSWTFAPYRFHGQPWRVNGWVRFEFATATQRVAVSR